MQAELVKQLLELNRAFYAEFAGDFSETRSSERMNVAPIMPYLAPDANLLDVGCGNGRLAERLDREGFRLSYLGVDLTPALIEVAQARLPGLQHVAARFRVADIAVPGWAAPLQTDGPFDLVLALAVLHHLPGFDLRQRVVAEFVSLLRPGGKIILSNWQFTRRARLRNKLVPWSVLGIDENQVEPGDALLDWKRGGTGYRYVHLLTEKEVSDLAAAASLTVVSQFYADADLNLYSVLAK